jgi:hypothetical protein
MRRNVDYPHKELKIIEKGYQIMPRRLSDPYIVEDIFCWAENHNAARGKLFKMVKDYNLKLWISDEELNYLNIPPLTIPNHYYYPELFKNLDPEIWKVIFRTFPLNVGLAVQLAR